MKIDKNLLIVGVLVLLVLASLVQAIQLFGMKSSINEIEPSTSLKKTSSSLSSSSSSSGEGSGIPTNLQNLPGMVGGC